MLCSLVHGESALLSLTRGRSGLGVASTSSTGVVGTVVFEESCITRFRIFRFSHAFTREVYKCDMVFYVYNEELIFTRFRG